METGKLQKVTLDCWNRIISNRDFVGSFIANPEKTRAEYGLKLTDKDHLVLGEIADKLFDHAQNVLQEYGRNLTKGTNDCSDHCQQHC
ncbi:MAG: hypothetical protein QMD05_10220 [Candidatus Brocadiaceae bacterium]|nr:hypothetical protein [Candidatus Brocadiaceae bacterium]